MSEIVWFVAGVAVGTFFGVWTKPIFVGAWERLKAAGRWLRNRA